MFNLKYRVFNLKYREFNLKYRMFNLKYRVFNLKVDRILIRVICLLRFTKFYITQLTSIYSKCWK